VIDAYFCCQECRLACLLVSSSTLEGAMVQAEREGWKVGEKEPSVCPTCRKSNKSGLTPE
jgi:hypothetical protein